MNYNLDETNIRFADNCEVKKTLKYLASMRDLNRTTTQGKSKDKTWHDIGQIPVKIYYSRWFQERFPCTMDMADRIQEIRKFFRANPRLMSVDRI